MTVKVRGKDVASGVYYDILDSTSLTGTGSTLLTVYPGVAASPNVAVLPPIWRVEVVCGTGSTPSVTMTVGASVVL